MLIPLAGILVVALVSAAGDYLWYELGVRHTMTNGILHGAALLMAVGGVLGAAAGRTVRGLPMGAAAGVAGALGYYAMAPVFGQMAMVAAWALLWVVLAVCDGRFLRRPARSVGASLGRGALAAVLGAAGFALVIGVIWGRPPAGGRNYAVQVAAWAFAWSPGLLAILLPRHSNPSPR